MLFSNIWYHKVPEKSHRESTAQAKACYYKVPETSCIESNLLSKACYHMDFEKSQI